MLHPSDARLIGVYSISTHTKVFVVGDGKTKIHSIYSSTFVHGTELQIFQRRAKKGCVFFLTRRQTDYDFGEPKLAGLRPSC
jgi:hypothetical protein